MRGYLRFYDLSICEMMDRVGLQPAESEMSHENVFRRRGEDHA